MVPKSAILCDAMNIFLRHYAANPTLNLNGEPVGGIVGTLKDLTKKIEEVSAKSVYVIWDGGGGSLKRRKIYQDYKKGHRPQNLNRYYREDCPDTKDNYTWQISILIDILYQLNLKQIFIKDCEADDVIGWITKYREKTATILSSDKDYYQLISDTVSVWSPSSSKWITKDFVKEHFYCSVNNFLFSKAIVGDPADNIDGVLGIGWKTVSKIAPLVLQDKKIEIDELFQYVEKAEKKSKAHMSLLENKDIVLRNIKLMELDIENLIADQIGKIENTLLHKGNNGNKIEFFRKLNIAGIKNIDRESIFSTFYYMGR